jgi:hypothetical protein
MRFFRSATFGFSMLCVGLVGLACDSNREADPPATATSASIPSVGWTGPSENGVFLIHLRPRDPSVPLNRVHDWLIRVTRPDGELVSPNRIAIDGGMPQHLHGFVTQPRVTGILDDGEHVIEGMKFHMSGEWTINLEVVAQNLVDSAVVGVVVGPQFDARFDSP